MSYVADEVEAEVTVPADEPGPRRSSIEKLPILTHSDFEDDFDDDPEHTAFARLPDEIIQQ